MIDIVVGSRSSSSIGSRHFFFLSEVDADVRKAHLLSLTLLIFEAQD